MTDLSATARSMIETARATGWSVTQQVVLNVFNGFPISSLTIGQIATIGNSLEGTAITEEGFQRVLTKLVRRGILRSHTNRGGVRRYEVAL